MELVSASAGNLNRGFHCGRNSDYEEGAAFGLVLTSDLATVIADNTPDGAETQTCPFADGFGGIERIENTERIANATAIIRELQEEIRTLAVYGDFQSTSAGFFKGIHGILDDFNEGLKELVGVALHARRTGFHREFDPDFATGAAQFQHLGGTLQEHAHIDQDLVAGDCWAKRGSR